MFIGSFVATPWASNCYIVAPKSAASCIIIDPGITSYQTLSQVVREHDFDPVAILCTHGHIDHAGDAAKAGEEFDCEVWIHPADEEMLTRPMAGLSAQMAPLLGQVLGDSLEMAPPRRVRHFADSMTLTIADISIGIKLAPGHTPGSCLLLSSMGTERGPVFSGDVLFAGAIGRMDMPGGNQRQMAHTLTEVVGSLADDLTVLPGHGQGTTIGHERRTNPYLTPEVISQLMEDNL